MERDSRVDNRTDKKICDEGTNRTALCNGGAAANKQTGPYSTAWTSQYPQYGLSDSTAHTNRNHLQVPALQLPFQIRHRSGLAVGAMLLIVRIMRPLRGTVDVHPDGFLGGDFLLLTVSKAHDGCEWLEAARHQYRVWKSREAGTVLSMGWAKCQVEEAAGSKVVRFADRETPHTEQSAFETVSQVFLLVETAARDKTPLSYQLKSHLAPSRQRGRSIWSRTGWW